MITQLNPIFEYKIFQSGRFSQHVLLTGKIYMGRESFRKRYDGNATKKNSGQIWTRILCGVAPPEGFSRICGAMLFVYELVYQTVSSVVDPE
jgi:hypothetical protein